MRGQRHQTSPRPDGRRRIGSGLTAHAAGHISVMRVLAPSRRRETKRRWPAYALAAAAVTTTAVTGARGVDPHSAWYETLSKPPWQPPSWAFGAVWTPLYGSIAFAAGHAANRAGGGERRRLAGALAANLALNASWSRLFFAARSPRAGLAGTALLTLSTLGLLRVTVRVDRTAAAALIPYAAWCAFATTLNADIVRRNGGCR